VDAPGHRHRHQAQGEAHGHQHQQFRAQLRVHHQDQLAKHQAKVGRNHVATEHRPSVLGLGLLIEPAFDDHVLAHHPQADDHPQPDPHRQPAGHAMPQHGRADDASARGVGPDVPYPADQAVADLAAHGQAEVVGGHQGTDPQAVDMIGRQAQRQVGTEQARADQHHQGGEIQRLKGLPDVSHTSRRAPWSGGVGLLASIKAKWPRRSPLPAK